MEKIDDMSITELKKLMCDNNIKIINASGYETKDLLIEVINKSIVITIVDKKKISNYQPKLWMVNNLDFDTITKVPSEHLNMEFYKLERDIQVGVKYEYFRYSIKDDVWCGGIYYDPNKIDTHMWFNKKTELDPNEKDEKKIKEFNLNVQKYDYLIEQLNIIRKEIVNDSLYIINVQPKNTIND